MFTVLFSYISVDFRVPFATPLGQTSSILGRFWCHSDETTKTRTQPKPITHTSIVSLHSCTESTKPNDGGGARRIRSLAYGMIIFTSWSFCIFFDLPIVNANADHPMADPRTIRNNRTVRWGVTEASGSQPLELRGPTFDTTTILQHAQVSTGFQAILRICALVKRATRDEIEYAFASL